MIKPISWTDGRVDILDQRALPQRIRYLRCDHVERLARAIESLSIRGAPLIGIAAAYGLALGVWRAKGSEVARLFRRSKERLARTRPTAVNLFWALTRMEAKFHELSSDAGLQNIKRGLLAEAKRIHQEDAEICRRIGSHGAKLLSKGSVVLTHCNTGSLATGGIGTALGIIHIGYRQGRVAKVYVDETRPLMQGARLTAWELLQSRIPAVLICDNMAASLMASGAIEAVIVGADRIADNGDFANKIGTYGLAVAAKHHGVPFYVAAPCSTIDGDIGNGRMIPIEQRRGDEVRKLAGRWLAPETIEVYNPSFDVTPAELVSALVTEKGVLRPPFVSLRKILFS